MNNLLPEPVMVKSSIPHIIYSPLGFNKFKHLFASYRLQATIYASPHLKELTISMTSKWAQWRLKLPAYRLFAQPFVRVQIKENIKATGGLPLQRALNAENVSI